MIDKGCYFIDTSALFKRYINEPGTDKLDMIFENAGLIVVSNLAIVEFLSNIKRLSDIEKKIDIIAYESIKRELFTDIANNIIRVEPVSSQHIIMSVELIDKNYMTSIDALQISSVLKLKENFENISLVCSDMKLCRLAEQNGIKVIMP